MRARFFGEDASTDWMRQRLVEEIPSYAHHDIDIRDQPQYSGSSSCTAKISCWSFTPQLSLPTTGRQQSVSGFSVNANGTHVLLEATRPVVRRGRSCVFTSRIKSMVTAQILAACRTRKAMGIDPASFLREWHSEELSDRPVTAQPVWGVQSCS